MSRFSPNRLKQILKRRGIIGSGLILALLGGIGIWRSAPPTLTEAEANAVYENPLTAPDGGLAVFHLGHSLVGRDMPVMLQQLAGAGHSHHSQLGWGTPLRAHWDPNEPINGFEQENDHPHFRDAKQALAAGSYDAVVLTEMVEIKDAIDYFDSAEHLAKWAQAARAGNPETRVYFYESWHHIDDPAGWLTRLDRDLITYWRDQILFPAIAQDADHQPIYLIPAGQVMAAFARAVEQHGGLPEIESPADLFRVDENGVQDTIHVNDYGAYLVALTHFAVLYHRSPVGLPHDLRLANGQKMKTMSPETAGLMQETVWSVVKPMQLAGIGAK